MRKFSISVIFFKIKLMPKRNEKNFDPLQFLLSGLKKNTKCAGDVR